MGSQPSRPLIAELVHAHYELLYRYAYRLSGSVADAEDLTQQAFMVAQAKLDQLRDRLCARSWLCAIVRNCYLKLFRDRKAMPSVGLDEVPEPCGGGEPNAEIDEERLQRALDEMPEDFRTPVILFYLEEFSYKEIAEQMQLPLGTVMSRLSRGRAQLRKRLAGDEAAEQERRGRLREPLVVAGAEVNHAR